MRASTTLGLLLVAFVSQAQSPYRPFPESDAGWVEWHSWLGAQCVQYDYTDCERTILFGQDTLIDGSGYHRLRIKGQCSVQPVPSGWPPECWYHYAEPWRDLYFFRQDHNTRQVFIYDTALHQDVLLFDFTLPVGPYPFTALNPWTGLYVVALDSVELNDGWHRTWRIAVSPIDAPFVDIIEGVGPTQGLNPVYGLEPFFEWDDDLICHSSANATVYPLGGAVCDITTHVPSDPERPATLRAFPNPATAVLNLTAIVDATLFDAFGRKVGSIQRSSTVPLDGLAPGVYSLRTDRGAALRFVKE